MHGALIAAAQLAATVAAYAAAKALHKRHRRVWLSPILVAPAVLLTLLLLSGTSYAQYADATHALAWMLGPATVAYAWPIHQRRALLRRYPVTLTVGVLAGLSLGLLSAWALGHLFGLPPQLAHSMLPRSVSTPFALAAAGSFGATPAITVLCVLTTGFVGLLAGEVVHARLGLRSNLARGASLGAAAHAIGTTAAYARSDDTGAVASLTMVITGIALVLLAPVLGPWLA